MSASWMPGRVCGVVLDWAGTTVDHGSLAPVVAVRQAFAAHGVTLSEPEARGPMGVAKREHIRQLLATPSVVATWLALTDREPVAADVESVYVEFLECQMDAIEGHADVIPGVPEAIARLRERDIAIGSTTGYIRTAVEAVAALAAVAGYAPDVIVAVDEVPAGRPEPWMLLRALQAMRVYPPAAVVKVGDTAVDMAEGRNAGTWAVGVTETGNELGVSAAALAALAFDERRARGSAAAAHLHAAGAHLVIPSVADLPAAIEAIEARLLAGERP